MAHFAKLNEFNIVEQVVTINNEMLVNDEHSEDEALGIDFCKSIYGLETNWVQTSYNNQFRGIFAGVGMTYDPELDIFIAPVEPEQDVPTDT